MRIKYCFFIKNSVNLISTTYGKGGIIVFKGKFRILILLALSVIFILAACGEEKKEVDYSTLNKENVTTAVNQSSWESRQKIKEIEVENNVVNLNLETTLDSTEEFDALRTFIVGDLESLQNFKDIRMLNVKFSTITKDKYGKAKQTHVLTGKIKGADLRKINFDNFHESDLQGVMSFSYVNPVIK